MNDDLYRRVEVAPEARVEVIHAAYRVLAKAMHPDITQRDTTRDMAALNAAYDILRDPTKRAAYDRTRKQPPAEEGTVYMSFGKHRGKPISSVPTDYLLWAYRTLEREGHLFDVTQELIRRGAI